MMKFKPTFTAMVLVQEYRAWGMGPRIERFGQYLCNRYLEECETFPELFYETDAAMSYNMAFDELLNSGML